MIYYKVNVDFASVNDIVYLILHHFCNILVILTLCTCCNIIHKCE